jgi:hypothetical protein
VVGGTAIVVEKLEETQAVSTSSAVDCVDLTATDDARSDFVVVVAVVVVSVIV